jgi:hypothetical protein
MISSVDMLGRNLTGMDLIFAFFVVGVILVIGAGGVDGDAGSASLTNSGIKSWPSVDGEVD